MSRVAGVGSELGQARSTNAPTANYTQLLQFQDIWQSPDWV